MAEPMHDAAHRSLWNGNVTTWCGLVFTPGQGDSYVFATVTCPACKNAKKKGQ